MDVVVGEEDEEGEGDVASLEAEVGGGGDCVADGSRVGVSLSGSRFAHQFLVALLSSDVGDEEGVPVGEYLALADPGTSVSSTNCCKILLCSAVRSLFIGWEKRYIISTRFR